MRLRLIVGLGLLVSGLLGRASRADDWSAYQHDLQDTGRSSASWNPTQLRAAWTSPAGFTAPVQTGNEVIASETINGPGGATMEYAAFNLETGQQLWTNSVVWTATEPVVMNGMMMSYDYSGNLRVYDVTTGALLSDSTNTGLGLASLNTPALVDDGHGGIEAYIIGYNEFARINITRTGSTVAWRDSDDETGGTPTIAGGSAISTGPGQFLSFDLSSGSINHFYAGSVNGGAASTGVYDQQRQQFYSMEQYGNDFNSLSAWHYTSNGNISFLWEIPNGPTGFASAALDASGDLWFVDQSDLLREYSPAGSLLRSSTRRFQPGNTPVIQNGYIWVNDASNTYALDMNTLAPVETLSGINAGGADFRSVGLVLDSGFILDRGGGANGFTVYAVPEPSTMMMSLFVGGWVGLRRGRRSYAQG